MVEAALSELQGVREVKVDLSRDLFTVSYDEAHTSLDAMFEVIKALGYEPGLSVSEFASAPSITQDKLPAEIISLLDGARPVALYFGAKWCGACKIMDRTALADESVKFLLDGFSFLKIDIEKQEEISAAFSIHAVPTFIIVARDGNEAYRHVGPLTASEIKLVLEQFSAK